MPTDDDLRRLAHQQPGIATYAEMLAGGPTRPWVPLRTAVQPATDHDTAPESPRPQGGNQNGVPNISEALSDPAAAVISYAQSLGLSMTDWQQEVIRRSYAGPVPPMTSHITVTSIRPEDPTETDRWERDKAVPAPTSSITTSPPPRHPVYAAVPPPPRSWLQALIRRFLAAKP